jgi:ribonuclease P protein component
MPVKLFSFPRAHRLSGRPAFDAVYARGIKQTRGPLVLFCLRNELTHSRLGLSVSRRVGTAPARNRIKRLIRESFRLLQHGLPQGYDTVVVVRPHKPLLLDEYQSLISKLINKSHEIWSKTQRIMP